MTVNEVLNDAEGRMKKAVETVREEFAHLRTGKATPAILDVVKVEYYGSVLPIKQVANIVVHGAKTLVVQPWDKSALSSIEKGIQKANLGLNPINDGNVIRIEIPPLTEERRKELLKVASQIAENGRVAIRTIRRESNEALKKAEKDGEISEDESFSGQKKVQELTDKYIAEVDKLLKVKEEEIMTI